MEGFPQRKPFLLKFERHMRWEGNETHLKHGKRSYSIRTIRG